MQTLNFSRNSFSPEIVLIFFFAYFVQTSFSDESKILKMLQNINLIKFTGFIATNSELEYFP
jgi:hypothetical protein